MTTNLKACHYVEDENIWITPKGRMSFVALARKFKSKKSKNKDDDGKYGVEISFPPMMDLKGLKGAANEAAQEKHGGKVDLWIPGKSKGILNPFLKAEDKLENVVSSFDAKLARIAGGTAEPVDLTGWLMIRTTAYQRRPVVRDSKGVEIDMDDLDVEAYPGRWARLMVRPKGYDNENKGVTFYLEGVQLLSHDEKTGGATVTTGEAFGAVADDDDNDDPLG